jgi:hypothetical protein
MAGLRGCRKKPRCLLWHPRNLRRSSVTLAAQTLQSRRLIRYRRGRIEILDRNGLKAAACECYEVISRTFDQFLEDKQATT